jgi:hypothetical protein
LFGKARDHHDGRDCEQDRIPVAGRKSKRDIGVLVKGGNPQRQHGLAAGSGEHDTAEQSIVARTAQARTQQVGQQQNKQEGLHLDFGHLDVPSPAVAKRALRDYGEEGDPQCQPHRTREPEAADRVNPRSSQPAVNMDDQEKAECHRRQWNRQSLHGHRQIEIVNEEVAQRGQS